MKKLRIDTVIRMCRRLERLFGDRIQSHLSTLGYDDVPAAAVSLLPLLEGKGVRPVTLANKLKISSTGSRDNTHRRRRSIIRVKHAK